MPPQRKEGGSPFEAAKEDRGERRPAGQRLLPDRHASKYRDFPARQHQDCFWLDFDCEQNSVIFQQIES